VTLSAVAELAGVSAMTVSRVINRDPRVAADTVQKVRAAMRKIGYKPPAAEADGRRRRGRSHKGLHTGRIAVLFPDTGMDALCTPLSLRWLRGLDGPLAGTGLQLILSRLPEPQRLPSWIDRRQIDGLIVRAPSAPDQWLSKSLARMPVVWLFDPGQVANHGDVVVPDDAQIGTLVAEQARSRGLTSLLVLDSQPENSAHSQRLMALRAAAAGITINHLPIEGLDAERAARLLAEHRSAGVFLPGTGSSIAHVVRGAARLAPSVRPWIVACCHDRHILGALELPISNIDIRPEALGEAAGQQILRRIEDADSPRARVVLSPLWEDGPFPIQVD
jgi:DNA-binding LacI/PurR family transcriptional regulator